MIDIVCNYGDVLIGVACQLDMGDWPTMGLDLFWWLRK